MHRYADSESWGAESGDRSALRAELNRERQAVA